MFVTTVNTPQDEAEFVNFPQSIYKGDLHYIRPLDADVRAVFDSNINPLYARGGECIRFLVRDTTGRVQGRIAAFVNPDTYMHNDQPTGGLGFFECENQYEVAALLFDTAVAWLVEQGMEAVDGPVNFGSRQSFWGLLIQGFTAPSYTVNYNPPYYQSLFETYGFKNYFNQYSYHMPVSVEGMSPLVFEKAQRVLGNPRYSFRFASRGNLEQLTQDFLTVYNAAWSGHSGVRAMQLDEVRTFIRSIRPIFDPRLIVFAYHDNQPVGFYIQLPEINQVVRLLDGKLGMWQKLKLIYHVRIRKTCTRVLALVFGVVPEHRGRGLEAAMPAKFSEEALRKGFHYKDIELSWVGDFNPPMIRLMGQLGARISKTHTTYRLLFDRKKQELQFTRCPKIGR